MRIAIVGCGYVADYYVTTLPNHPQLELVGVYDRDSLRGRRFKEIYKVHRVYESLQELLDDARVDIVLNLTNPTSHYAVSRACLLAGKHVYSEKPLAMSFEDAEELVRLAAERGLYLSGAPCSVLGEAAQTVWKALREGLAGKVRLAYAELEEGCLHCRNYDQWTSPSGLPWPHVDEFETGLALEHAGYYVTWLAAFFGPARRVTAFASCQVPDKDKDVVPERMGPDFTVSCIEFASGVAARFTCGWVAEQDRSLRIFGDAGVLSCRDGWKYASPVCFEPPLKRGSAPYPLLKRSKLLNQMWTRFARKIPPVRKARFQSYSPTTHNMDFSRGVAELAAAIREKRACRLSARFVLHVTEIVLAMQPAPGSGGVSELRSSFEPMEPMPWAQSSA